VGQEPEGQKFRYRQGQKPASVLHCCHTGSKCQPPNSINSPLLSTSLTLSSWVFHSTDEQDAPSLVAANQKHEWMITIAYPLMIVAVCLAMYGNTLATTKLTLAALIYSAGVACAAFLLLCAGF
jgi:hypothetical protein